MFIKLSKNICMRCYTQFIPSINCSVSIKYKNELKKDFENKKNVINNNKKKNVNNYLVYQCNFCNNKTLFPGIENKNIEIQNNNNNKKEIKKIMKQNKMLNNNVNNENNKKFKNMLFENKVNKVKTKTPKVVKSDIVENKISLKNSLKELGL
jgi:hypothetical protein